MLFVDETKQIIDIMLLKGKAQQMSVGEALGFWYKASLIPAILAAIVAGILILVGASVVSGLLGPLGSVLGGIGAAVVIVGIFVSVWIITPIAMIIGAAILHFFGKTLLRQFKNSYSATLAATVYAELIGIFLLFITEIPVIGWIISIIVGIWSFVALLVWLARFQNTSWVMALVTIIVEVIVIVVILFVVLGAVFFSAIGHLL